MGLKFWTVLIWGKSKSYSNNSCFLSQGTFIAMVRGIAWLWQELWDRGMRGALVLAIMNDIKQKKKIDTSDAQTKRKRAANKYSKLTDLEIEVKIRELEQRNAELEAENMALKKSIRSIKF